MLVKAASHFELPVLLNVFFHNFTFIVLQYCSAKVAIFLLRRRSFVQQCIPVNRQQKLTITGMQNRSLTLFALRATKNKVISIFQHHQKTPLPNQNYLDR